MINRYQNLIGRTPRVLVVGDLMIDHYLWGSAERVSPEAPVVVVDVSRESSTLGGAGNVVSNLLALGAKVEVASVIGEDENGEIIASMLAHQGVGRASLIRQPGRTTSRKSRVMASHHQVMRFDRESKEAIDAASEERLEKAITSLLERVDMILLSDYGKGVLTPTLTQRVIALARARGIKVLVDPKGSDYSKYRGATLVTPNRKEAQMATGITINSEASLAEAIRWLYREVELEYAMITLSEDGMALYDGTKLTKIPTVAREVYDVTGAGDTVLAALGFALACGAPIIEAAHFANSAAAVVVGKLGSATATIDEVLAYENSSVGTVESRILNRDELAKKLENERAKGRKIVFTNGCFDILHAGHVRYLEQAKALGDILVVALNSDASVRALKGESRPVIPEGDRAYLVAALSAVDYVTIFDEETPYELIKLLQPDLLVKGGDYEPEKIVGYDIVTARGGEVKVMPFVEGRSTTSIIQRICAR
ncbi:MAG: D-glycero-beta-D-manno-heptose-7-phosphate kinase [Campylobacterales bacterium]